MMSASTPVAMVPAIRPTLWGWAEAHRWGWGPQERNIKKTDMHIFIAWLDLLLPRLLLPPLSLKLRSTVQLLSHTPKCYAMIGYLLMGT